MFQDSKELHLFAMLLFLIMFFSQVRLPFLHLKEGLSRGHALTRPALPACIGVAKSKKRKGDALGDAWQVPADIAELFGAGGIIAAGSQTQREPEQKMKKIRKGINGHLLK